MLLCWLWHRDFLAQTPAQQKHTHTQLRHRVQPLELFVKGTRIYLFFCSRSHEYQCDRSNVLLAGKTRMLTWYRGNSHKNRAGHNSPAWSTCDGCWIRQQDTLGTRAPTNDPTWHPQVRHFPAKIVCPQDLWCIHRIERCRQQMSLP